MNCIPANQVLEAVRHAHAPENSQSFFAYLFAFQHKESWKYCAGLKSWFGWDGTRWKKDDQGAVLHVVQELVDDFLLNQSPNLTEAEKIKRSSAMWYASIAKIAGSMPDIAVEAAEFDANPWILNTPGCVLDLKNQKYHDHKPAFMCTKITAVTFDGEMLTPIWDEHLHRITQGAAGYPTYIEETFGYALTGDMSEHQFWFYWGDGRNGKGTLLETVAGLMGSYATTAPPDTFTVPPNGSDRHPTEVMALDGYRLIISTEIDQGRRWHETRIKEWTGSNINTRIKARGMKENFSDIKPVGKLVISGNHKPRLFRVDVAIRKRIKVAPTPDEIMDAEKDKHIDEKLQAEWPGILAKLIKGCWRWQDRGGFEEPEAVQRATAEYLADEDTIGQWLEDRCVVGEGDAVTYATDLYSDYKEWCKEFNETLEKHTAFGIDLKARKFEWRRDNRGVKYLKIRLRGKTVEAQTESAEPVLPSRKDA